MVEEPPEKRPGHQLQARAYGAAIEAVMALVIAVVIGIWVDHRFECEPYGMLSGIVVGFASMILRVMRMSTLGEEEEKD